MAHGQGSIKIIHRSKLKHFEFTFAAGDLFDADVDAIVNSEQTDFILSKDPETVSGQIWSRYGIPVQRELWVLGDDPAWVRPGAARQSFLI